MTDAVATVAVAIVTCISSGAWVGWFAGRTYERSKQALHRMRKRRPVHVNVDYDFAMRAFNSAGYSVVRNKGRMN